MIHELYNNLNKRLAKQPWFTAVMQRNEYQLASKQELKAYCITGKLLKHKFNKFNLN